MDFKNIPLFPLSAHILPGGIMPLRIFEPRYVRMVKEASASNAGFVMCMLNERGDKTLNTHIYEIGTYVKIIDFDLLKDGLLGIKVEGLESVTIENIRTEHDGLRIGDCSKVDNYSWDVEEQHTKLIRQRLQEIFEKYEDLSDLYTQPNFDAIDWVVFRWLELLPVDAQQKQSILAERNGQKALNYLSAIIY